MVLGLASGDGGVGGRFGSRGRRRRFRRRRGALRWAKATGAGGGGGGGADDAGEVLMRLLLLLSVHHVNVFPPLLPAAVLPRHPFCHLGKVQSSIFIQPDNRKRQNFITCSLVSERIIPFGLATWANAHLLWCQSYTRATEARTAAAAMATQGATKPNFQAEWKGRRQSERSLALRQGEAEEFSARSNGESDPA